jgi:phosphoglycerate kinase
MRVLKDADVSGKRVILRGDLDVPLRQARGKLEVADDTRLKALLPTLKHLLRKKASVLIIGHLGRPEGKDVSLSLYPVSSRFGELLGREIKLLDNYQLPTTNYQLAMLENLRFWPGEEKNEPVFAQRLAALGDLYVNDAFAVSHRKHASVVGITKHLPAYAGIRLEEEVRELGTVLEKPARPLIFILGGAKLETKKPLVPRLAKTADTILLGGLLMFSQDLEGVPNIIFPVDAREIYDIGPKSIKLFVGAIEEAKVIVWNGPLGRWEDHKYERGTRSIAEALANSSAKTVVGGGDTIAALSAFGLLKKMSYVSLGGGAMLEFLAGKKLPGLTALGYVSV